MHIAVLSSPVPGHIIPMTTLANELIRRGHEVSIFSLHDTVPFIKSLCGNGTFVPYGKNYFPPGAWQEMWGPLRSKGGDFVTLRTTSIHTKVARAMCEDLPALILNSTIELLLIDQVQFHGRAIAEYTGRPFVTISCAHPMNLSPDLPPPTQKGTPARSMWQRVWYRFHRFLFRRFAKKQFYHCGNQLLQRKKISMYRTVDESYSPLLHLIPSIIECDFPQSWQELPKTVYCGAFISQSTKQPSIQHYPAKPLIYVSLGTLQNENYQLLQTICTATESLNLKTVVGLGQWDKSKPLVLPGNSKLYAMAPQKEVLQKAALCISHGGYNSFNEALFYGVPLLILPITNDQPGIGSRVEALGLGKTIPLHKASQQRIKDAIAEILCDASIYQRVSRVSQKQQEAGGVSKAASMIEAKFSQLPSSP